MATGLIIGKFMPPHRGHQHLIDSARRQVEQLTVILFSKAHEPIPGRLRHQWLSRLYPDLPVLHITEEHPIDFNDPAVWELWIGAIRRVYPHGPDFTFSSEGYGEELARRLGARHILVDLPREQVPVSATLIRSAPLRYWDYLPPVVRPYYVKRVCIVGAESTGKTTLAEALARHYQTAWVPEYARAYLEQRGGVCKWEDMVPIARGMAKSEERLAEQANRVLICDTDLMTTSVWSEHYFGRCDEEILRLARERRHHLYFLTGCDVPWVFDGLRDSPHNRQWFHQRYHRELTQHQLPFLPLEGSPEQRLKTAVQAIDRLLGTEPLDLRG